MPRALLVDWELAKSMFLQGVSAKDIATRLECPFETVRQRARRGHWPDMRDKAKQVAVDSGLERKVEAAVKSQSQAQSERVRSGLAATLVRSVEKVESLHIASPKHAIKLSQELEAMVRNAKTVFGWDTAGQAPAVRISIMASSSLVQVNAAGEIVPDSTPEPAPIEIESVPVLEQSKLEALPEG